MKMIPTFQANYHPLIDPYGAERDHPDRPATGERPAGGEIRGDKALGRCLTCQRMWDDHDGFLVDGKPTGPDTAKPLCFVNQFEAY